jgi:hypothetical protein
MKQLFANEHDAIKWVASNIALAIKPKKKAKTIFVFPFTSSHAHIQVVKNLAKELFKYQQQLLNV